MSSRRRSRRALDAMLAGGLAFVASLGSFHGMARSAERHAVAIYWEPPASAGLGVAARAAFVDAVRPVVDRVVDGSQPAASAPSLLPALDAAKGEYLRFAFPAAIARLDDLQRLADARGGGDLDGRQLSEIFFYRGLAKLETAGAEAAWDDLVRAARLDPTRVLDPARFPPRSVAAYKRAASEVAALPRGQLALELPPGATIRVDGLPSPPAADVTVGPHFVSVVADGYEPWAGVVAVAAAPTRVVPPLHLYQPPQGDRLLALAGPGEPRRLVLGALERAGSGWRFTARDVSLPDGKVVSESVALGDVPTRAAVQGLLRRLDPPPPPRRWVPWAVVAGGAALALAIAAAIVLARDDAAPNVAGDLGPWR